jgi:endo-1,4-beta-xylanase
MPAPRLSATIVALFTVIVVGTPASADPSTDSPGTDGPSRTPVHVGGASASTVVSGLNHKCLDADTTALGANGTKVQLWDCVGQTNQLWYLLSSPISGYFKIVNYRYNKCLDADVSTGSLQNGTRIQLWPCQEFRPGQWWTQPTTPKGVMPRLVPVQPRAGGFALDVDISKGSKNGMKVRLWQSTNAQSQSWLIR